MYFSMFIPGGYQLETLFASTLAGSKDSCTAAQTVDTPKSSQAVAVKSCLFPLRQSYLRWRLVIFKQ